MAKQLWKPGTMIYPLPAVLVSCGNEQLGYNMLTIAWTGTVCTNPAMCYISVRPERYSYQLIMQTGEFVINLTNRQLAKATDWCGVKSGRDTDKFEQMHLTPQKGKFVDAPIILESPLNIECKVKQIIPLGSHDMFLAEVLGVQASEEYINPKTGLFDLEKANLIAYSHGQYFTLAEQIGKFGWTVRKNKRKN